METTTTAAKKGQIYDLDDLLQKTGEYLPQSRLPLIREAFDFAQHAHEGQKRKSGEPFMQHPLQTALVLADLRLDHKAIAAGLLHDVPEDCNIPLSEIERKFGPEISRLVDGVTKLSKIAFHARQEESKVRRDESDNQAENLRKMLISMVEDIRVVLIKLADRLHNMRTLGALLPERRRQIAFETLEIYAPLAHRLGIWQLKWELEDLAFRHLEPEKYREIARLIANRRLSRENYISQVITILKSELEKVGIQADVTGRPKHIYSVHKKIEKYAEEGKDFGQIYDLLAVRVLVNEVQDCYSALGVIHSLWHPIPGQFDDYIANPKESMYQSLHTTVMCLGAKPLEVQIRTHEMHRVAEYGIAAHWRYKEGSKKDVRFEEKVAWLRQLMEWQNDVVGAREFVESVKTDIFQDQVFVYTPKGEIKDLPAGSTPLDFAYRIHTDLGHRCIGAKINGRLVPLDYQLKNGDTVEILSSRSAKGPSRDWLNPNLGYVQTSHARAKIRQWFKRQERAENVERGKELLEKELKRLGLSLGDEEEVAHLFKYERLEDFLAAIGYGEVNPQQIAVRLTVQQEKPLALPEVAPSKSIDYSGVRVMGVGDLLTHLARCCNPVPGDEIIGYVSRTKGVTIHRRDCPNVLHEDEKERLVPVDWGSAAQQMYPVHIRVEAWDRVGLLRDITTVISQDKVNMTSVALEVQPDHTTSLFMTLETTGIEQLTRVLGRLEGVRGVLSVVRDGARSQTQPASTGKMPPAP